MFHRCMYASLQYRFIAYIYEPFLKLQSDQPWNWLFDGEHLTQAMMFLQTLTAPTKRIIENIKAFNC